MNLALARLPMARLVRTRRSWLPLVGWSLVALVSAIASRRSEGASGADHVMRGSFGYVVLPLVAYGVVSATLGGGGLRRAVRGLVALGAYPRRAAIVTTLVAAATSALLGGLLALVVCAIAHGPADAPLAHDLASSFGISVIGGAAYAAYFCAGSAIGKGTMRAGFLAIDWIIGSSDGAVALFTPRGHVTALLGGVAYADVSPRASSVILVVLFVAYGALAVALTRRA